MPDDWFRPISGGLEVIVRLTPKSSRDGIDGVGIAADGASHLKVRVRAAPENGSANRALIALVSKSCGVARSRIRLASGATSRVKRLHLECDDHEAVRAVARLKNKLL